MTKFENADALAPEDLAKMQDNAAEAARYVKAIGHQGRLMILCYLCGGERSVSDLEQLLDIRQAAVSQQLGRLRKDRLVTTRRVGKTIYYSLADERARRIVTNIHDVFCRD